MGVCTKSALTRDDLETLFQGPRDELCGNPSQAASPPGSHRVWPSLTCTTPPRYGCALFGRHGDFRTFVKCIGYRQLVLVDSGCMPPCSVSQWLRGRLSSAMNGLFGLLAMSHWPLRSSRLLRDGPRDTEEYNHFVVYVAIFRIEPTGLHFLFRRSNDYIAISSWCTAVSARFATA